MIGDMKPGEDIEHYADKYEERQEVLEELANEEDGDGEDEVEIIETNGNWVKAYFGSFEASAKIFPNPSGFGIDGDVTDGHISKLSIRNKNGDLVFNYDRGLDFSLLPSEILATFLEEIESYAKNEFEV